MNKKNTLYDRVRQILESARSTVARSVNSTQVVSNWLIGREIVEEEQKGKARADYGKRLVETLSAKITRDFGPGYSVQNLFYFKQFYLTYSSLLSQAGILHAPRGEAESAWKQPVDRYCGPIVDAVRQLSGASIGYAVRSQFWKPGQLHS
jgi:hypothetical protein